MSAPTLLMHQIAALRTLSLDPAQWVPAGTLGILRRLRLVGKTVTKAGGRQKTTSPITDAGRAALVDAGYDA